MDKKTDHIKMTNEEFDKWFTQMLAEGLINTMVELDDAELENREFEEYKTSSGQHFFSL